MMVKEHKTGLVKTFQDRFKSVLNRLGSETLTRYAITETTNQMGRLSDITEVSSTIQAFIRIITAQDKQLLDAGVAQIGNGKLYAEASTTLDENDEVEESGKSYRWKLITQIEGQPINDDILFQSWIVQRKET